MIYHIVLVTLTNVNMPYVLILLVPVAPLAARYNVSVVINILDRTLGPLTTLIADPIGNETLELAGIVMLLFAVR